MLLLFYARFRQAGVKDRDLDQVKQLCHTDGMVSAGIMGTKLPCIGSHEGAGTVVDVGSSVTEFDNGDRVMAGLPKNRCSHYPDCLSDENYRQYCPNLAGHVGVTLDGAFAEYMIVDGRESAKIPDEVSFETAAPLACAGCTVWIGVVKTELKKAETIAIVGAGGRLGHLGCQFAKALSWRLTREKKGWRWRKRAERML